MEEKICPICGEKYPKNQKYCPNCAYKEPMNYITGLVIALLILLPFSLLYLASIKDKCFLFTKVNETLNLNSAHELNIKESSTLSGKTFDEISAMRREYVKSSSVFSKIENYTLNPEIFKIDNKSSWNNEKNNSIVVNNPELLINLIVPEKLSILPQKVTYDDKNKTISAHYSISDNLIGEKIYLNEINARDFSYDWIFCDEAENIEFENLDDNISIMPYKMQGYYETQNHVTDYRNYQELMAICILEKNSSIKLKLWKQNPSDFYKKADLTYIIYFE